MEKPAGQNDILVTTLIAATQAEIDLHALEWRLPVSADDAKDTSGRKLSSSLFEEAGHELHQLPEKLNVNGGSEHCQGRSRLPFITMLAFLHTATDLILQNRDSIYASTYHPPRYNANTTTKPSTEGLLPVSPVSTWSSPPHKASSISTSSDEACTPVNNESCNSFDHSSRQWNTLASSAVNTFGDTIMRFPPTWDNGWMPEADPQRRSHPSSPLSAIQDELAIDEEQEDNEPLLQPSRVPKTRQTLHKTASGGSQKPRRSSRNSKSTTTRAGKHSTRPKTPDKDHRLFASHQRSSTSRQLPTTRPSYPPNRATFPSTSTDSSKGCKRTSHNLVEKQYRTRLNGLFAALLSAIPDDVLAADVNGYTRGHGSPGKMVSKGAILALARRHIEALDKRVMSLKGEREILMEKIQRLERVLVNLGVEIIQ